MPKTRKLRAAFKAMLEPELAALGFSIDYPEFRRPVGADLHLATVEMWKHGGAFAIDFAVQNGPFHDWTNTVVPADKLTVAHLPPQQRARLVPVPEPDRKHPRGYFKYHAISDDRGALDALVGQVVTALPQMDAWLRTGAIGPNVQPFVTP